MQVLVLCTVRDDFPPGDLGNATSGLQRCCLRGRPTEGRPMLVPYAEKGGGKLFCLRTRPRRGDVCYLTVHSSHVPQAFEQVRKSPSQKVPPCLLTKHGKLYFHFPARGGESRQIPLKEAEQGAGESGCRGMACIHSLPIKSEILGFILEVQAAQHRGASAFPLMWSQKPQVKLILKTASNLRNHLIIRRSPYYCR